MRSNERQMDTRESRDKVEVMEEKQEGSGAVDVGVGPNPDS